MSLLREGMELEMETESKKGQEHTYHKLVFCPTSVNMANKNLT